MLARWVVKTYMNWEGGFPGTPAPPPLGASGRSPGGGPCGGPGVLFSLRDNWVAWPGPSCGVAMAGSATLQSGGVEREKRKEEAETELESVQDPNPSPYPREAGVTSSLLSACTRGGLSRTNLRVLPGLRPGSLNYGPSSTCRNLSSVPALKVFSACPD